MRYITAVHMNGGSELEHIARVRWEQPNPADRGEDSRAEMVRFIRAGGDVRVSDRRGDVEVVVVDATPPYIKTVADGRSTNNLLVLPRY